MTKNWKIVLNEVWKSQNPISVREISENTGLKQSQVHTSIIILKNMKCVQTEQIRRKAGPSITPIEKILITPYMKNQNKILRVLQDDRD